MQPLISIIIPTFNRAHLLGETLDSVLSQTYQHWECLVVDDGSKDHTAELMEFYQEKDSRISYHKRPLMRPKGANACRNYGFEISSGNYINWFDSDDIMHSQKLEVLVNEKSESNWDFSVCKTVAFKEKKENIIGLRYENQFSSKPLFDYIKMKIGWMTPSALWNRRFLSSLNYLFDEELNGAQEWEFHARVLSHRPNYVVVDKCLDLVRKHTNTVTYNDNANERFWHYFLARLKIYNNQKLILDKDSKKFLNSYLLNSFKKMIVTRNPYAIKAFRRYLWPSGRLGAKAKLNAFLAIISYRLINRGNLFLKKIK